MKFLLLGPAALLVIVILLREPSVAQSPRDQFASDRPEAIQPASFDADRAMGYLEALCKIGPRVSGSPGMTKQQDLLNKHFLNLGAKVEIQRFTARQKSQKEPVPMANLIARWHPERPRRVIFSAHYDTRPIADQEPDGRRWREPFVSANDGGSGVALLMELAHGMQDLKTSVGIDFVLFDGEEYIFQKEDSYFFGSRHFAEQYQKARKPPGYLAAINLGMIAGKGAKFPIEMNSWFQAAPLVQDVWNVAQQLGCTAFQKTQGPSVSDDHLPLNRAGIPAIDIIDFSYPHWHRLSDVPGNCSGQSMEQVARVLSVWVQRVK